MTKLKNTIQNAQLAAVDLATIPAKARQEALTIIASEIRENATELATLIVEEGVKTIREARLEVDRAACTFEIAASEAIRITGETIEFEQTTSGLGRFGHWTRRPIGLIAAITPYNDPLNLVAHKVAPAIACGAPIIVKPHEATPSLACRLLDFVNDTALPQNTVQVIQGGAETVIELVRDNKIQFVSFTGGKEAAAAIAKAAGPKKMALELGGIGTSYVHHDADVEKAASALASGIIWAGGQNCVSTQHILVNEDLFPRLSKLLTEKLAAIKLGDRFDEDCDMARQINTAAADRINNTIDNAIEGGAKVLLRVTSESLDTVGPCLLSNVSMESKIFHQEIFGPVGILTPVVDINEAITTCQSLGPVINTSIFTDSLSAAHVWDQNIDAGTTIVNDSTDFRVDHMPFGGNGSAGIGREGVSHAIEAMTEKHVWVGSL